MLPKLTKIFSQKRQTSKSQDFLVACVDQESVSLGLFEVDANQTTLTKSTKVERSSDLFSVLGQAVDNLSQELPNLARRVVIGLSDDSAETITTVARLSRENRHEEIEEKEIERVLAQIGEQYSAKGKKLFFSSITSCVLDGVKVGNPVGARGEVLELGCFNAYLGEEKLNFFDKLAEELDLNLEKIVPLEYAVVRKFLTSGTKDGILLKILKEHTSLSFVEDSNIVGVKIFALGTSNSNFWSDGIAITLEEFLDHPRWPQLFSFYDSLNSEDLGKLLAAKLPEKFPRFSDLKIENLNQRLAVGDEQMSLLALSEEGLNL